MSSGSNRSPPLDLRCVFFICVDSPFVFSFFIVVFSFLLPLDTHPFHLITLPSVSPFADPASPFHSLSLSLSISLSSLLFSFSLSPPVGSLHFQPSLTVLKKIELTYMTVRIYLQGFLSACRSFYELYLHCSLQNAWHVRRPLIYLWKLYADPSMIQTFVGFVSLVFERWIIFVFTGKKSVGFWSKVEGSFVTLLTNIHLFAFYRMHLFRFGLSLVTVVKCGYIFP